MLRRIADYRLVLIGLVTAMLAACGGGGDGGNGTTGTGVTYTGPTAAVSIDNTNGGQAINLANDNVDSLGIDAPSLINPATGVVLQDDGGNAGKLPGLSGQVRRVLEWVKTYQKEASLLTGVTTTQTTSCLNGGTVTVTASLADPNTLTPGDFYQITFNACNDGFSVTSGTITLNVTAFTGDTSMVGDFTLSGNLVIPDFRSTTAGVTARVGGQLDFEQSRSGTLETGRITGRRFVLVEGSRQLQLTDFDFYESLDTNGGARTYSADFTLASTEIGGSITVTTMVPFQAIWSSPPTVGTLRVTGGNGAWVELEALSDGTNVMLRWDLTDPYDGADAGSKVVAWNVLPNTSIP